jgi:type III secretion protein J
MKSNYKIIKFLFLFGAMLINISCSGHKVTIAAKQPHEIANKIVSIFLNEDINVTQQSDKDGSINILVDSNDLPRALQLLSDNGGIPHTYDTLGNIFKKDSFISSPLEEQARLEYALSQEISALLIQLDGVVDVKVTVSLPLVVDANSWQPKAAQAITASVYLRCKSDSNLPIKKNQIKFLVSKTISGLTPDNVAIYMEETKSSLD